MRKLLFAAILLLTTALSAQEGVAVSIRNGIINPGSCSESGRNIFLNRNTNVLSICVTGVWTDLTVGGITQAAADLRYQPLDADLTAIAGLVSAADRLAYFTGSGTASLTVFTSTARTLLDDATTSDMRTTLGLGIGLNVQAWDTDLDTWATKTPYAGVLTITTAKTANITSSLTFSGTDATVMTFPSTSATIARTDAGQTFTGANVFGTVQTSGNVGIGKIPNATTGRALDVQVNGNQATIFDVNNTDASGISAQAVVRVTADTAQGALRAWGTGHTSTAFGLTDGGYVGFIAAGNGLLIGAATAIPIVFGTTDVERVRIAANGDVTIGAASGSTGQCTLNGAATATCTATVPSGCIPVCAYNSASVPHTISCSVTTTTLTAVSATTLDAGTVNYHCF